MSLVEGSTENATLVTELIVGLRERGLDVTRPILAVLDGSKALRRAVLDVAAIADGFHVKLDGGPAVVLTDAGGFVTGGSWADDGVPAPGDLRRCLAAWEAERRISDFPLGIHDTPDRLVIPEKLYGRAREIDAIARCEAP